MIHILLLLILARAGNPVASTVNIDYMDCARLSAVRPKVSIVNMRTGRFVAAKVYSVDRGGHYNFQFTIAQGYYNVGIGRPGCGNSNLRVATLIGHRVAVVTYGSPSIVLDSGGAAIAGILPTNGLHPVARCIDSSGNRRNYESEVQDSAYYFSYIAVPAVCDVGIPLAGSKSVVWIFHSLSFSLKPSSRYVVKNMTWPLIEAAIRKPVAGRF